MKTHVDLYLQGRELGRKDVWWLKTVSEGKQRKNVPDYLLVIQGRMGALEIKHPGRVATPTPGQERQLRKIRRAGGRTLVSNELTEIVQWLEQFPHGT